MASTLFSGCHYADMCEYLTEVQAGSNNGREGELGVKGARGRVKVMGVKGDADGSRPVSLALFRYLDH